MEKIHSDSQNQKPREEKEVYDIETDANTQNTNSRMLVN